MNMQDMYGCDITTASKHAHRSWNKTLKGFLSHAGATGSDLTQTIKSDPGFALAYAAKGLFSLLLGRRELDASIRSAYQDALACDAENPVTFRERQYIRALGSWIAGKPSRAIYEMECILSQYPHDPLAMKMSHAIRFMLGDIVGMRNSLENVSHVYRGHEAEGYFLGCHAFALEETGDYAFAEKRGRRALELAGDDAWGLHAVAHVFDMTGRASEGLAWIDGKQNAWKHCNNFRFHVWWHIALMYLDLGNYDKVLELYDEYIRKEKTDDYRDISNATSVLLRLEFEGIEVGDRWQELAEISSGRTQDNCVAFADLHYMMALCNSADADSATRLLSNMQACQDVHQSSEFSFAIRHPGLLVAQGLEAFRDQDFSRAYQCLAKARSDLQAIGGSHAQRDIFERLSIESGLRAGMTKQVKILLQNRDLARGHQDGYSHSRWTILETLNHGSGNIIALQGVA